ncbi:TerB family tellurite resistance protein [Marinomonas balearica]|uniref:Putative tellurite resistance protein B-like protein n=1 Tax=Marinomonas balearica TaxID=491947 RepID=A0A4R6M6K3_9GAMM|nr:TerB family tellurite resistance protein [Marinomonas balearica]TDO96924.1 putative tellurite resistance protein B-like protein [Marinomonas balearica]
MIQALRKLFLTETEEKAPISYQRAVAALLIEVMLADHETDEREVEMVKEGLRDISELGEDIDAIFDDSLKGVDEANDLYQFTKVINEQASNAQKMELLKGLWRVAFADNSLDAYEDQRIRRISELLFMPHSEFIQCKLAVQSELGD